MPAIRIQILIWHEEIMKQNRLLEDPVRSVFLSYLVPSVSATLVTSIYILADTMMIGRGIGSVGILPPAS